MNIIVALLIFTVIVVAHEFGHFIFAKKNGVGVPEFSVGMGPRIITFAKTKEKPMFKFFCSQKVFEQTEEWKDVTKYSWKLFPIGGSCAMIGEDEENDAEDSFNSKGKWARFTILFAGPFFNFILAFLVSIIILANSGIDYPIVDLVYENQPASEAGIKKGDYIKSINGKKISIGREVDTYLQLYSIDQDTIDIVIERDGKEKTIPVNTKYKTHLFGFSYSASKTAGTDVSAVTMDKAFDKAGIRDGDKILSVQGEKVSNGEELKNAMDKYNNGQSVTFEVESKGEIKSYDITPEEYETNLLGMYTSSDTKTDNPLEVLKYSVIEVKYWIVTTVRSLAQLITQKISVKELSGPVGIVNTVGTVIDQSSSFGLKVVIINMLYMSVLLSANLGVMNLLPIPALDGGRILFVIIEAIRRKPIDREKEGYINLVGFVLLMMLMVFIMYNDIVKILH